jgi:hypothetical protein
MKRLAKIFILSALMAFSVSPASAGVITFYLDTEFSGATPPAGTAPWVEATFVDVVGGVQLTISATNLTGSEFINEFYFNFNPSLNAALYLPSPAGTGTQTAWNLITAGNQCCQADGDGQFDFSVDFPPPPGTFADLFTAGETFVLNFLFAGITTADFNYPSVNGPPGKDGFYAAAHVQGIGPTGGGSGWIGGGPRQLPEPSVLLLLCIGLGLARVTRRKSP